jgi:hypothetical protein
MQTPGDTMAKRPEYQLVTSVIEGDTGACEEAVAAGADLNFGCVRRTQTHPPYGIININCNVHKIWGCVRWRGVCGGLVRGHGTRPTRSCRSYVAGGRWLSKRAVMLRCR